MLLRTANLTTKAICRSSSIPLQRGINLKGCQWISIQNKSTIKTPVKTTKPTLTQSAVSELSLETPEGVNGEFYQTYLNIFNRIAQPYYEKVVIKHSELNSLLLKVSTKEELALMPSLIEHWRRRQLPSAGFVTRYTFWKLEELESPDVGFQLLADRHSYGLFPLTRDFNRVLNSFAKQLKTLEANEQLDEATSKTILEKMMMTYSLIYQYDQLPSTETYPIVIEAILNSPLKESWFGRVHQLVTEAKHHQIHLDPILLSNLKPLYEQFRPDASV